MFDWDITSLLRDFSVKKTVKNVRSVRLAFIELLIPHLVNRTYCLSIIFILGLTQSWSS